MSNSVNLIESQLEGESCNETIYDQFEIEKDKAVDAV